MDEIVVLSNETISRLMEFYISPWEKSSYKNHTESMP
jgi:hypothetical protein